MISDRAFRYYKKRYRLFKQFDKRGHPGLLALYRSILPVCTFGAWKFFEWAIDLVVPERETDQVIAMAFTSNQLLVAKKLRQLGLLFPTYSFGSFQSAAEKEIEVSDFLLLIASLANAKETAREVERAYRSDVLHNNIMRVIKLCGLAYMFRRIFRGRTRVLILFNDHSPYSVLAHDIAKSQGLKTIYIQHAPVNEDFPALYHDWNILFSEDAAKKYDKEPGAETMVLFDVRFLDGLIEEETLNEAGSDSILICTNDLDDQDSVLRVVRRLRADYHIIIRPHPREKRSWPASNRVEVSRGRTIWEDLRRCHAVLANESAVALEAIFKDKLFYKCSFFSPSLDNYDFLRSGLLLKEYDAIPPLLRDLENQRITYDKNKLEQYIGPIYNQENRVDTLREIISELAVS